ncbi:MAG TPA: TAXI family TRAP transporter solute-binding subunit, partial [Labilithrix sp.]
MAFLDRPLAAPLRDPRGRRSLALKLGVVIGVVFAVGFVFSKLNFTRNMHRLDAGFVSGSPDGAYHAIVDDLAALAAKSGGRIRNIETNGSSENIKRLSDSAATGACDIELALVQDGSDFDKSEKLRLVGRLPKSESVFFLGKDADKITEFAQLAGFRIGIGPHGGGTARVVHQIFAMPELAALKPELSSHTNAEQLDLAKRGELDLAAFVIDEDAPFIVSAIRDQGLQIAGFSHIDVIARRMPHFRTGRIGAGQFEPVKILPAQDKRVLRVDTLVVGNGCTARAEMIDVMMLLRRRFPDFVRHNKETPNATGLELADSAKAFFEHDGPEMADEYVPWLTDVMPPANWAYVVMGISLLFNAMGAGHRFRLWRIDDARVKLENELAALFGSSLTLGDISRTKPTGHLLDEQVKTGVEALIRRLEALAARSRRQSLSVLVPMGQEMAYRYQEEI